MNSEIADGSDLGTCRPQVTSVGDLPTSSASAVQLIPEYMGSARTPPVPKKFAACTLSRESLSRARERESGGPTEFAVRAGTPGYIDVFLELMSTRALQIIFKYIKT